MIAQRFEAIKNNILHPELKLLMQGFANAEETFSTYQGKQDYDNHMVLLARSYPDNNSIEVITFMSSGKPTKKTNVKKVKLIGITTKSTNQAVVEEDCPDCPKGETVARGKVPAIDIINVKKVVDENPFVKKEEEPVIESNGKEEDTGSKLEVIQVKKISKSNSEEDENGDLNRDLDGDLNRDLDGDLNRDLDGDLENDEPRIEEKEVDTGDEEIEVKEDFPNEIEDKKEEPVLNPDSPESIKKYFGSKKKLTAYARGLDMIVSNSLSADQISQKIYDFLK